MRHDREFACLTVSLLATIMIGCESPRVDDDVAPPATTVLDEPADQCPTQRRVIEIREADPVTDSAHHRTMRDRFIQNAKQPNTTVLLGPNVVLDFSDLDSLALPIEIGRCVTIRSVAYFRGPGHEGVVDTGLVNSGMLARTQPGEAARRTEANRAGRVGRDVADIGANLRPEVLGEPGPDAPIPEARSSTAPGPLLKFGSHRSWGNQTFFQIRCYPGIPDQADHVRISGFRIYGPSFGHQTVGDKGILIVKCVDIEISNMEIAGWGGEGIRVQDATEEYPRPQTLGEAWQQRREPGMCKEPPYNGPQGRIASANQVRIFNNHIHHNQQPSHDGHAGGYGVQVAEGAHAHIYQNLFAHNRHAIEGKGDMGGYDATHNLVLRYGGIHWDSPIIVRTHQFDIHGTGDNGFDGFAGNRTSYMYNAFQYRADNAISIRGSPRCGITISNNVFPHPGLEDDWGDDAVKLQYDEDLDVIKFSSNTLKYQSFGKYSVCDFDADGVDDLFLATGVSWWFSGMGEFPWRYLAQRTERIEELRFGYFDADNRCDVVKEENGAWLMSSGGTGAWYRLGQNYAPFSQVRFGRFDPNVRDHRPGVTRRTTHAFWRTTSGQWKITTLTGPNQGWRNVARSGLPMSALQFGDFNGDGVTDVLSVQRGRWAISASAVERWDTLNQHLGDDVRGLYFADIDNNNIDDIIRLDHSVAPSGQYHVRETYEWMISYDGRTRWTPLKTHQWTTSRVSFAADRTLRAFVGRFGLAPGAGVLTIDRGGVGRFHAPLESRVGASPDWMGTFAY